MVSPALKVSIVILNYNGADLLPLCLPSLVEAAHHSRFPTNVVILDNLSTDEGLAYVSKNFPEVKIAAAKENRVLCSYNDYLAGSDEDVAILLNNDIRVDPGFVDPLMEKFLSDPRTFLVAPRVMSFDGSRIESARARAGFRFGLFWCDGRYPGYEKEALEPSETFSSGFGAFSREKFLKLGGYDERYQPGIMEDVDLCYRAQTAGFHLYYEPSSVVYHMGQASFKKKFGASKIARLAQRNNFLFMWKNFSGAGFWLPHVFFLPVRVFFALLKGSPAMLLGLVDAFKSRRKI